MTQDGKMTERNEARKNGERSGTFWKMNGRMLGRD